MRFVSTFSDNDSLNGRPRRGRSGGGHVPGPSRRERAVVTARWGTTGEISAAAAENRLGQMSATMFSLSRLRHPTKRISAGALPQVRSPPPPLSLSSIWPLFWESLSFEEENPKRETLGESVRSRFSSRLPLSFLLNLLSCSLPSPTPSKNRSRATAPAAPVPAPPGKQQWRRRRRELFLFRRPAFPPFLDDLLPKTSALAPPREGRRPRARRGAA